jgi:hypothetical protein
VRADWLRSGRVGAWEPAPRCGGTIRSLRAGPNRRHRGSGTIRREWLDPVIVFTEADLCRRMKSFVPCDHGSRTYLWLAKDAPEPRLAHPLELGPVVAIPQVGGLHHRYQRRAAWIS